MAANSYTDLKNRREDILQELGEFRKIKDKEGWERGLDILKEKILERLDSNNSITSKSEEILEEIKDDVNIGNRLSLAVATIYISHFLEGEPITMKEMREAIGISEVTIR
ncbi:MAG: hypothetical protein ABEK36_04345, partial [Candidatus Aenigmatarchaeota archaeon]